MTGATGAGSGRSGELGRGIRMRAGAGLTGRLHTDFIRGHGGPCGEADRETRRKPGLAARVCREGARWRDGRAAARAERVALSTVIGVGLGLILVSKWPETGGGDSREDTPIILREPPSDAWRRAPMPGQQASEAAEPPARPATGPIELVANADRDRDRYGRLLREALVNGVAVSARLVDEGLARPWRGGTESWC